MGRQRDKEIDKSRGLEIGLFGDRTLLSFNPNFSLAKATQRIDFKTLTKGSNLSFPLSPCPPVPLSLNHFFPDFPPNSNMMTVLS